MIIIMQSMGINKVGIEAPNFNASEFIIFTKPSSLPLKCSAIQYLHHFQNKLIGNEAKNLN